MPFIPSGNVMKSRAETVDTCYSKTLFKNKNTGMSANTKPVL